ncbi:MAG: hypothetical protein KGZ60_10925 [Truepera sp.]|nr:hypothetical protein [Truepera sp.]
MRYWPVILLLVSSALALTYRVDPRGGPLDLEERVAAAFAAWRGAEGVEVTARLAEEADTLIGYGSAAAFGPDTHSLTVARTEAGRRTLEVRLNPASPFKERALLHEVGVLLGLSPSEGGIMNPRFTHDTPSAPTADDLNALRAQREVVPEDINRDGVVDFYDLWLLAQSFGRSGVNLPADINRDGVVDRSDLALLQAAYIFGAPAETPPATLARPPHPARKPQDAPPAALPEGEEAP